MFFYWGVCENGGDTAQNGLFFHLEHDDNSHVNSWGKKVKAANDPELAGHDEITQVCNLDPSF